MTIPSEQSFADARGISLLEFFRIARKRWSWLLAGALLGALAAFSYVVLCKPTFETRASIRIGKVYELGMIEEVDSATVQLIEQYGPRADNQARRNMPYLKQELKLPGQNNILRLVAVGNSPEETKGLLDMIVEKLMRRHEQIYKDAIWPLQQRIAVVDRKMRILTSEITELIERAALLKDIISDQTSAIAITRSNYSVQLSQLEYDRVVLQQKIVWPNSYPSEVVMPPSLPKEPVAPRKIVIVASGVLFGLLLSLFAALVKENYSKASAVIR